MNEIEFKAIGAVSLVDLLHQWSVREPEVCKKTFLDNVFELPVEGVRIINLGKESAADKTYLINLAIEERVKARGWLCKCESQRIGGWHCVVYAPYENGQPRNPYAVGNGSDRATGLLKAYLKAIGGEKDA